MSKKINNKGINQTKLLVEGFKNKYGDILPLDYKEIKGEC